MTSKLKPYFKIRKSLRGFFLGMKGLFWEKRRLKYSGGLEKVNSIEFFLLCFNVLCLNTKDTKGFTKGSKAIKQTFLTAS
jgi:hypothetical protein